MENAAERITLLLSEMRAAKPGIVIERRLRKDAHSWIAEVRAGFVNGAFPCWCGRGQDERLQCCARPKAPIIIG